MARPKLPKIRFRPRRRRGIGHDSKVGVATIPEIGAIVRLRHEVYGIGRTDHGLWDFDYEPEQAIALGDDLIAGAHKASHQRRQLEREARRS